MFEIDVERVMCGAVRDFLEREKFGGRKIEWREGSGFLSRVFTIKGSPEDLHYISNALSAAFSKQHKV